MADNYSILMSDGGMTLLNALQWELTELWCQAAVLGDNGRSGDPQSIYVWRGGSTPHRGGGLQWQVGGKLIPDRLDPTHKSIRLLDSSICLPLILFAAPLHY